MDSKDFENIYKSSNQTDTNTVSSKQEISNSQNEKIEKVNLTEDEELNRWYEPEAGDPNVFVEYKNFTWQRSKSNETVNYTREGKGGFSFYYAFMYSTTLIP